ncbi:branched-chain amino acid ABC transporter ATP-binding protein [Pigmentiphaga sp. NML080357]|uniref:ABC transporter ATP-binding protein n=1 Tax=Pigmentiphaga sp. NML080357 TaxID=2008675 RepID=UPI000B40C446|nr:ABC transporter ATP-binding protein [Pigmentiphaga sp. NML080357]OVZ57624.1 branched-chain amino acid ABC transporter ATP-binding protein [Pigmentiphaga sp. NML080357]
MSAPLQLVGLCKQYGALAVTRDVNLALEPGARHALIGPNGAGKSTLVHQITGVIRPNAGKVLLDGRDVTDMPAEQRVKLGLARTFQINSLFTHLSVAENIGLALSARGGLDGRIGRPLPARAEFVDEAADCLRELGLLELAGRQVSELAYGQRRQIEIALALALKPKVLLLDEPVAGVPSTEGKRLFELLERLPVDVAVLVIEHDMSLVFRFARRITVLVEGAVLLEGGVDEVRTDPRVRDVYLGKRGHHD